MAISKTSTATGRPSLQAPRHSDRDRIQPRFQVGDRIGVVDGGRQWARKAGGCAVIAVLPQRNGVFQYRIKSDREPYERIVDEFDLHAFSGASAHPSAPHTFDYAAPAELYAGKDAGRSGPRYRRFDSAAEAVRYALEHLSGGAFSGAVMEVGEMRFDSKEMDELYRSNHFPLVRAGLRR